MRWVPPPPVTLTVRTLVLSRHGGFVIRGHDVHAEQPCGDSLFACTGQFRADGFVTTSGIFTLGPVDVKDLRSSVVVCAGDFTARQRMTDCVVAGGKVTCPEVRTNCTIVAGGRVVIPKRTFRTISSNVAIKEKQAVPLEALGFPPKK